MSSEPVNAALIPFEQMAEWYDALLQACQSAQQRRLELFKAAGVPASWEDTVLDEGDLCFEYDSDTNTVASFFWRTTDADGDRIYMEVPRDVIDGTRTVSEWVAPEIEARRAAKIAQDERYQARRRAEYERLRAEFGGEGRTES